MTGLRRIRFSTRALLGAISLVAALLAWFSIAYVQRYQADARLVAQLTATGGSAYFQARQPEWLWERFGDDVGRRCVSLILSETDLSDSQIAQIHRLHDLEGLYLDQNDVTEGGLDCLAKMDDLVALSLRRTSIRELPPLSHMEKLVDLDLSFTDVSEVDLSGLDAIESLNLRATRLNDDALKRFPRLPSLKSLDIAGAPGRPMSISDGGIEHITAERFPKLKTIHLYYCDISDAQIARLKFEFPGIRVSK